MQRGFLESSKRISGIDKRMKIGFEGVNKRIDKTNTHVDSLHNDFKKTLDGLDKVAMQYEKYLEEREMRDVEIERLKRWVEQIAQKVGVELTD